MSAGARSGVRLSTACLGMLALSACGGGSDAAEEPTTSTSAASSAAPSAPSSAAPASSTPSPSASASVSPVQAAITFCKGLPAQTVNTSFAGALTVKGLPQPNLEPPKPEPGLQGRLLCSWVAGPSQSVRFARLTYEDDAKAAQSFASDLTDGSLVVKGMKPETHLASTGAGFVLGRLDGARIHLVSYSWMGTKLSQDKAVTALVPLVEQVRGL